MKKKVIILMSLITLIIGVKGLNVSASTEAKEVARSQYSNRNVNEVASYLDGLDETYSKLFRVRFTDYRYVVEFATGSHSIVSSDDSLFYPVSNKVQITNTHQTSLTLEKSTEYLYNNSVGFYQNVGIPYYILASDTITNTSYDAEIEVKYEKNQYGDCPTTMFEFNAGGLNVKTPFARTPVSQGNIDYTTDATNRVGQYAQLYIYGNYVSKTIRIRKEKRKVSGNYEVLSREDCTIYVFVIKGYMVNWTFE